MKATLILKTFSSPRRIQTLHTWYLLHRRHPNLWLRSLPRGLSTAPSHTANPNVHHAWPRKVPHPPAAPLQYHRAVPTKPIGIHWFLPTPSADHRYSRKTFAPSAANHAASSSPRIRSRSLQLVNPTRMFNWTLASSTRHVTYFTSTRASTCSLHASTIKSVATSPLIQATWLHPDTTPLPITGNPSNVLTSTHLGPCYRVGKA